MLEQKALNILFPKYSPLFTPSPSFTDPSLQHFITNDLPSLISTVESLESVFLKLQTSHNNLVLKSSPTDTILQSFVRKVVDKTEKYMNSMDTLIQTEQTSQWNFQDTRRLVKQRFTGLQEELQEKYVKNKGLNRSSEEMITQSIYRIIEYYNFTKADIHNIANKYLFKTSLILSNVKYQSDPTELSQFIKLDDEVKSGIEEFVDKRMKPFLQKKDFLWNKIRDLLKQPQNRYAVDFKNVLKIILGKQKGRCQREIYNILQKQLKSPHNQSHLSSISSNPLELNNEMNSIKLEFNKLKSSPYYLEIIRGTFKLTFGNESNSLENLFGISKLEQYLLGCVRLTERMSKLLWGLIGWRKEVNGEIGRVLEEVMDGGIDEIGRKELEGEGGTLESLIEGEFARLKELLVTDAVVEEEHNTRFREERAEREEERRKRVEEEREKRIKEAERKRGQLDQKAQKQRRIREQKKQIDEQKRLKQKQQMKQKQQLRKREEAERVQKYKKQKERLDQQKMLREQTRKQSEMQRKSKLEEEKQLRDKEREERNREREKKAEEDRQKQAEIDGRNKEIEAQRKRKAAEEKAKQQERLEEKKKAQEMKRKEEKQKEDKRKAEELRVQKEKAEQEERKKELKRKEEERKKQEEKAALEKKKRDEAQLKDKKLREQRELKEKKEEEEKQRERVKKEQERVQNEKKQRLRLERENQEKQRVRIENENKEKERVRLENEKKEKERVERQKAERQRAENERVEREKIERQRLQKQKVEKQKLEKQRQQQQRIQKQRIQKQRVEKQKLEKQRIQQQKAKKAADQLKSKQRIQQQTLQKQKQQQQKILKQNQQKQALKLKQQQQKQRLKQQQSNKPKPPAKKQSQFDYNNMYQQDFQPQQQSPIKKPPPPKKQQKDDFDFLDDVDVDFGQSGEPDYDDDFEKDASPHDRSNSQMQGGDIVPKELTTEENLNVFNNSIKSTQYMRKNKPNIYMFNNMRQFTALFEEMIQNGDMFIFSDVISSAIYEVTEKLVEGGEGVEKDLEQITDFIGDEYMNTLQSEEFDTLTKYYFIFKDPNPMGLIAFQFEIGTETEEGSELPRFTFFLTSSPQKHEDYLLGFIKVVCMIFGIEIGEEEDEFPEDNLVVIPESSVEVLKSMEGYLPPLLVLFNWMYETRKDDKEILIDQYTVQRFFYCSHALTTLYPQIQAKQQQMCQFYDKLYDKYNTDKDIQTHHFQHLQTDNHPVQKMVQDFKSCVNKFSKQKTISSHLLLTLTLIKTDEQGNDLGNISLYVSMSRNPMNIKFYIIGPDIQAQDFLSMLYENIVNGCAKEIDGFEVEIFTDFTRHNGLYRYVNWSLPVWAQLMTKRKIGPKDAMLALNFSMLPLISVFKGQD